MSIPLLARVECRSEGSAEETPVAVLIGGARVAIEVVVDNAFIGSPTAGEPSSRLLTVILEDGQRLRLTRVLPDGAWRVFRIPG